MLSIEILLVDLWTCICVKEFKRSVKYASSGSSCRRHYVAKVILSHAAIKIHNLRISLARRNVSEYMMQ